MATYAQVVTGNWMTRGEMRVHDIFNRFTRELYDHKLELLQEINSWRDELLSRIERDAEEQKRRLEQEYRKQQDFLESIHQQFINTARHNEHARNYEQVDQLMIQCNALKFELAALEFDEQPIVFIKFLTEQQAAQKKRDERNRERTDHAKSKNNLNDEHRYHNAHNVNIDGSSTSRSTSASKKDTDTQGSSVSMSPGYDNLQRHNNNSNRTDNGDGELIDKCPTCFMIFPGYMTFDERTQHVQEHFNES